MYGTRRFGRPDKGIPNRQSGLLSGRVRRDISKRVGFTLIELLVVISIIALLLAILVPTLQRVRKHTKSVVCKLNLKQWGTIWATSVEENDGFFPGSGPDDRPPEEWLNQPGGWGWGWGWRWGYLGGYGDREWYNTAGETRLCPMAVKPVNPTGGDDAVGGTFLAWGRFCTRDQWGSNLPCSWENSYGSYGINHNIYGWYWRDPERDLHSWRTPYVKSASNIPLHLDSSVPWGWWWKNAPEPPECDSIPTARVQGNNINPHCINRHDVGINGLFMDWSVRKIGLKELWTLKWHRQFDASNIWTKAGGVQPKDWPEWMRGFKDY
jgi:prepilin-type N-terminal cleavage/methylation domain-containing protein